MKTLPAALAVIVSASPALAEWRVDNGVAIVSPAANNSTMELLAISCGEPFQVEVYSRGGPVRPDRGDAADEGASDYFYQKGKVQARVDGQVFPLTAAGSEAAVVLFGEGSAEQSFMGDVPKALIDAMKGGTTMTLAFDVTPENHAADGSPFETAADFPLAGAAAALDDALTGCN